MPGFGGGPAGDAYVELHVEPHPYFHRKDDNIHVEVPQTPEYRIAEDARVATDLPINLSLGCLSDRTITEPKTAARSRGRTWRLQG